MALQLFVGSWPLFQFIDFFAQLVGLFGRGISPSQRLYPHTGRYKQNRSTQTSMSQVGLEPTIPVFERAERVDVFDRAATVIGKKTSGKSKSVIESTHYINNNNFAHVI
jgi:hypothetical protein